MAIPAWFNLDYYKAQKLAQLNATDSNGAWTAAKLDSVMTNAGFGGAEGWFNHFNQYGSGEHCAPNDTFNAGEYLAAKLKQLQASDKLWEGKTIADVQNALAMAGGEWAHYQKYGSGEGISPSNAFDEVGYLDAKLTQLQATDPTNWTGKTNIDVRAAFQNAGLTALEHYMLYGKGEGITAPAVADGAKVTVPADFFVFGGKGGMPSAGFDLTRGSDNLTGTAGNDSFFAANPDGFETLNSSDTINGGAGSDTLYIGNNAGAQNFSKATIKSIEHVVSASAQDLDVSTNAEVLDVVSRGNVTATLKQGVTIKDAGDGVGHSATPVVRFVDATGTDDAATLKLDSSNMATLSVEGIEKLTVNATGRNAQYATLVEDDDAIGFTDNALKELTVTGEGSLKLDGTLGTNGSLSKVDFSANKGGVEVAVAATALAKEVTVTGGAGKDAFVIGADTSTKKITLDLGAGDDKVEVNTKVHKGSTFAAGDGTDTLVLNAFAMTEDNAKQFTGFEKLTMKNASTFDSHLMKGITDVTVQAHNGTTSVRNFSELTLTDNGLTGGSAVDAIADLVVTDSTTLDLTFDNKEAGKTAQNGVTVANLHTDATKLNVHSAGNVLGTDYNEIGSLDVVGATTVNKTITKVTIDGDQNFKLTDIAASALTTIDANELSGDLNVDASAHTVLALTVTGGSGKNTIVTGVTEDKIIGGSGENVITAGNGIDSIDISASKGVRDTIDLSTIVTTVNRDSVKGFEAGEDKDVINLGTLATASAIDKLNQTAEGQTIQLAAAAGTPTFYEITNSLGSAAKAESTVFNKFVVSGTGVSGALVANDDAYLVAYDGDDAYLYYIKADSSTAATNFAATDLDLVGTFYGVGLGNFDASNFTI